MALKDLIYQVRFDINDSAIDKAEGKTEKLEDSADQAVSSFDRLQKQINKVADQANKFGDAMQSAGRDFATPFLAGTAAMGAGLGKMVSTAANFEQGMSRVGALSGATQSELTKLSDEAERLGATTSFSATDAAEGMQFLAMAGYETSDIISAMPGLLDTAAAGQLDLGRAADITSNILSGFNLEADETGRVADVLSKTFTSSNTDMEMLGDTMKYVAPIATSTGQSLEMMAASAGILGNAGIQGEQAGTSLRASLIRLADPPREAQKQLDALGVSVTDSQGNFRSLSDIVGQFNDATKDMSQSQKVAAVSTVVGTEASSAFLTLMQAGPDQINEFTSALENSGGTAKDVANKQLDNLLGSIELMKSAFEGVSISIGGALIPILRALVDGITALFDKFNSLSDSTKTYIAYGLAAVTALMALAAAFGVAVIFIGTLANSWAGFLTIISKMSPLLAPIRLLFSGLGLVFSGLGSAVSAIGTAFVWLFGRMAAGGAVLSRLLLQFRLFAPILGRLLLAKTAAAAITALRVAFTLLTGPIGIIITALTLVGVGLVKLYQENETFRDGVNGIWESIKSAYGASIDWIMQKIDSMANAFGGIGDTLSAVGGYLASSFDTIGNTIATFTPLIVRMGLSFLGVSGPVGWVIATVVSLIATLYKVISGNEELRNSLVGAWNSVMQAIQPVIGLFGQLASGALGVLVQILTPAAQEFARAWQELQPSFQETGQVIMQSFNELKPAFAELGAAFAQLAPVFAEMGSTLGTSLAQTFQQLSASMAELAPVFAQLGSTIMTSFAEIASMAIPMLTQAVQQIIPVLVPLVQQIVQLFTQFATTVIPILLQAFQSIFPIILQVVMSVLPIVIGLISQLVPIIVNIATMLLPILLQMVQMVFPIILQIIQMVMPIVIQIIQTIVPIIMNIVQMVLPLLLQIIQLVFPIILQIIQVTVPIITMIIQTVATIITTLVVPAIQLIMQIVQLVFPIVMQIIQVAVQVITAILQVVASIITTVVIPAIEFILNIVQTVFPAIQLIIETVINLIVGIINVAMDLLQGDWEGAWNTIKETASTIWDNIMSFFADLDLFQIGADMLQGLIDGIGSMASAVVDKVKNVAQDAWDGFKGIFDIHSPSRLMYGGGEFVMQGAINGVNDMSPQFTGAMEATALAGYAAFNPMQGFSIAQAAVTPNRPSAQAGGSGDNIQVEINVEMQGGSPEEAEEAADIIGSRMEDFFGSLDRRMGSDQEL